MQIIAKRPSVLRRQRREFIKETVKLIFTGAVAAGFVLLTLFVWIIAIG